jgi:hypothetical protein
LRSRRPFHATREKATPVSRRSKRNGQGQLDGLGRLKGPARLNRNNQLTNNQLDERFQPH